MAAVYLDAQDVSRFATTPLASDAGNALSLLKTMKSEGRISIYQSVVLLSEISHRDDDAKKYAIQRASILKRLFQPVFLVSPYDLIERDLQNLAASRVPSLEIESCLSSTASIMGLSLHGLNLQSRRVEFRQQIQTTIEKSTLPRRERRKLLAGLSRLESEVDNPLHQFIRARVRENPAAFFISEPDILVGWLAGRIPDMRVVAEFRSIYQDPTTLIQHIIDEIGMAPALYDLFRKQSASTKEQFDRFFELVWEMKTSLPEDRFRDLVQGVFTYENFTLDLAKKLSESYDLAIPKVTTVETFQRQAPSVFVFLESLRLLLREKALSNRENAPSMKATDLSDAFHALYAPYTAYFRADRHFGTHLISASRSFQVRVCRTLADLVEHLRRTRAVALNC